MNTRVALVGGVLLVSALALFALWPRSAEPAVPPGRDAGPRPTTDAGLAPAPVPAAVRVAKAEGLVEVRRGGEGEWQPLGSGETLAANDVVRTGGDGAAELSAGDHVVRLIGGTDVTVQELTQNLSGFLVGRGLVGAEATPTAGEKARTLEMRAKGTDATVRATDGQFRMSANGEGLVAVGVERGEVNVSGAGKSVVLKKGERTVVRANQPPADPIPFATELLVDVAWPGKGETNKRVITVTGRTDAGALVFALGEPIAVREDGSFKTRLKLREGKNRIQVKALDVSGNRAEAQKNVVVSTKGADSRFNTRDLWKKK